MKTLGIETSCDETAIVPEIRAREFYEKPTEKRKRLMAAAVKRARKSNMKVIL